MYGNGRCIKLTQHGGIATTRGTQPYITIILTVECLTHITTLTLLGDSSSFCLQNRIENNAQIQYQLHACIMGYIQSSRTTDKLNSKVVCTIFVLALEESYFRSSFENLKIQLLK